MSGETSTIGQARLKNNSFIEQIETFDAQENCLGFQSITDLSEAVGLTIPEGARIALVIVENAGVRFREDGVAPSATVGMPVPSKGIVRVTTNLSGIQFIEQASSSGAALSVTYYGDAA